MILVEVGEESLGGGGDMRVMKERSEEIGDMVVVGEVGEVNDGVDEGRL